MQQQPRNDQQQHPAGVEDHHDRDVAAGDADAEERGAGLGRPRAAEALGYVQSGPGPEGTHKPRASDPHDRDRPHTWE
jgi:hypothetical protein